MKLRLLAGGALALGSLLLLPAAGLSRAPARAELAGFSCHRGLDPVARTINVTTVMRPLPGTRSMSVRIDLLSSRNPVAAPRFIRGGDLSAWISPHNPTLGQRAADVWDLKKIVVALAAPATYQFRVQFRWDGVHHRVLSTTTRYTRRCQQRELRPDLQVRSIQVSSIPNRPDRDLYQAVLVNQGNTGAGPFQVLFAPADGSPTATDAVSYLGAHATLVKSFVGPVCTPSSAPTVTADSAQQVDDLNRTDNSLRATCPAPSSG